MAKRFKAPGDNLRLVMVCDMWLTGFDCPPVHTMYLDKPLAGHNLMQAIARVNRVFGDKPGGLVVDFLGVFDDLRDALQTYAQEVGEDRVPVRQIQDEALPVMEREFEQLRDFFDGFDYSGFTGGSEVEQLRAITAGADYVLDVEERPDGRRRFMRMVTALSKAFALAVPLAETEAVRQILSGAVVSDGVIGLFEVAGLPNANLGILSEEFLEQIAAMEHKNLALETLRKLLNDQIRVLERTSIVRSRTFRQALEDAITKYNNRAVTTIEVIEELLDIARMIRDAERRGEETGLSKEEVAFYDALAENESAREVLKDEKLRFMARELSDTIKRKTTLDWTQRDAVRADMRRSVRRLLSKYGYPPDLHEAATKLVLRQAELMAEGVAGGR